MRLAFDTNLLAYAEGAGDAARTDAAHRLVKACIAADGGVQVFVPAQVLGELFSVLTRKLRQPAGQARVVVRRWSETFKVAEGGWSAFQAATDLCVDHGLQYWDALIFCVAAEQRCRLLLSEDMLEGFTWRGVTVVNPFAAELHPLLREALPRF